MQNIVFVGGAKSEFEDFPQRIRDRFSLDIVAIRNNNKPFSKTKSLDSVGKGAIELIKNGKPAYRVVYCAKYGDTVYVLHAFVKKTNGVDRAAVALAKQRYKEMLTQL